ncbi:helix-turn-helix domain-containing protein [Leptospira borgpetersenii serovar Hardjo-bovis]|nr:hypothetical protein LBK6_14420 [Leptospira borgpetersenii serovar Hardjo]AWV71189.1 transcriptional regulator [Leptospira borgpetersenii serovar Hardjo-bovis]TQE51175.1 helix-turn-helix domain-containing protein [Leptospira borgpetersenii]AMX62699.1 hypothetical protein LBK9_14340 [Leptospira borgpetersenii serovar Hardjo]AMX65942.1 hypothetical protein LBK30_14350 [Leptospira borgpetersenii serovar Hardjo]
MNITAYRLAKETKINPTRVSEIIHGKREITANTALRFSKFLRMVGIRISNKDKVFLR